MTIRRYANMITTDVYEIIIDEDYVESLNERIAAVAFVQPLTVEDVETIWKDKNTWSRVDEMIAIDGYKEDLVTFVQELIDEDMWDSFLFSTYSDCEGWYDKIEKE